MKTSTILCAATLWLSTCPAYATSGTHEPYRIHAGDSVAIYINGEISLERPRLVDRNGAVPVEFAGGIFVDGLTTEQAEEKIERELLARNLFSAVDVLVLIEEHRPVYVLGLVEEPGSYPSHLATTVAKALALAGGPSGASDTTGNSIGAIFQFHNAEASLPAERRETLRATFAAQRVEAEISGAQTPEFETPKDHELSPEFVADAKEAELRRFELRQQFYSENRQEILDNIRLLEEEIKTTVARRDELQSLVDILAEEAESSEDLLQRGLRTQAINVTAQRNLSLARVDLLEMERAFTLAQQRLTSEKADLEDLALTRALELLEEQAALTDRVAAGEARIAALRRQISVFPELLQAETTLSPGPKLRYLVERRVGGDVERIEATDDMDLEPGDLLMIGTDLM